MKFVKGCFTACALMAAAFALEAQESRLQPDFTFKRVGVPTGNVGKRITVQVTPQIVTAPTSPATPEAATAAPRLTGLEWFWQEVSPDQADSGPGRLEQAMLAINDPPGGQKVPTPRLQALQDIAAAHGIDILRETVGTDVSPALVLAMISVESSGQVTAESHAGAQGLMQLMPATAARFGVTDSMTPAQNIKGGVAYLAWLLDHFDNDPVLVLAGYNAGEGAVRDHAGVPPYPETRAYVPKVLAAFATARGLCMTPPELITDGCVFSVNNL